MIPVNVRQEEFRFQEVRPVAAMIQDAVASSAAELILWLYLRLGEKPEKTVRDVIFKKREKRY